jgi:hypothetical protein
LYCIARQQRTSRHRVYHEEMIYESRVHESDSGLSNLETLVVDAREDGGEHRARSACASDDCRRAFVEDDDIVADG